MDFPQSVLVTVPGSTFDILNYDSGAPYSNYTTSTYPDGQSVQKINLWNLCNFTTGCQVGSAFSFGFDWIRNPLSQVSINQPVIFSMKTPEGYVVESTST